MPDITLDFGDRTWDQARGTVITTLQGHEYAIEGNGKSGLREDVEELKSSIVEIRTYAKASSDWAKAMFIVAIPLLLGIAGLLVSIINKK